MGTFHTQTTWIWRSLKHATMTTSESNSNSLTQGGRFWEQNPGPWDRSTNAEPLVISPELHWLLSAHQYSNIVNAQISKLPGHQSIEFFFCLVARRITTNILSDDITEIVVFHVRSCFSKTRQILWQTLKTFDWWATECCIPPELQDRGFKQEAAEAVISWQAKSCSNPPLRFSIHRLMFAKLRVWIKHWTGSTGGCFEKLW